MLMNVTVAITGASGAVFGREMLRALEWDERVARVHFVASENSLRVLAEELGVAGRAWKEELVFRDEVAKDAAISALLSPEKLARTFDYTRQLGNVDAIFKRVLGE
jgi:3-polyprenyl-4-hydroxybenzoate decarboxylase